jgi:hypothetical protein
MHRAVAAARQSAAVIAKTARTLGPSFRGFHKPRRLPTMGSTINRGIPSLGGVKVRAEESAWLKFVDRKAENDSWHGRYAMEFCPLADKYASEDHSSIRIPRELSRAVLRINIEGSGKGRGGQVAQAIVHYDCVRPRSNYMFSATIVSSRYRCRYPQPRKRSWRNP